VLLKLGPEVLRDLEQASRREWLLADGLGGYACSTPIGFNTRRYHGLLVAATRPPLGRMVLLAQLGEAVLVDGRRQELSTWTQAGTWARGYESAQEFSLDPLPTLSWQVEGGTLSRSLARVHGAPASALVYSYEGAGSVSLELRPLLAYRDHHALQRENPDLDARSERRGPDVRLAPYAGCPELWLRVPEGEFVADPVWCRGFVYERERERGYDCEEDLFSHGVFLVRLYPGEVATLLAWAGPVPAGAEAVELLAAERDRLGGSPDGGGLLDGLRRAAPAFLASRGPSGRAVIAGYPWFSEWGRDTLVALPGLCLATRRLREAREILAGYARLVEGGLVPSRFPERGGVEYDAADAALWFVLAVQRYLEETDDRAFVRSELEEPVLAILRAYRRGTRHGIHMTPEGLLAQGEPSVPLTWMDARLEGGPVTPRGGEAVELQALWYNALLVGAGLAHSPDGRRSSEWGRLARLAREAFRARFWSEELGYLADVVHDGVADFSLRPNQLFAIGLPHALLSNGEAARILALVGRELLTPVGLRSLAPADPAYRGRYEGDSRQRDGAYHQGTVWPWLMGVYFDALIRVHGEQGRAGAREWLRGFERHLEEAGLGYVSEVFDGEAPHRAGGAIAQAWSVAELLRIATLVG
jgi:predicted glycogen debranching enzyme